MKENNKEINMINKLAKCIADSMVFHDVERFDRIAFESSDSNILKVTRLDNVISVTNIESKKTLYITTDSECESINFWYADSVNQCYNLACYLSTDCYVNQTSLFMTVALRVNHFCD